MQRLEVAGDAGDEEASNEALPSRYTLIGELARGGLGRVFLATDDALGRPVAVKQPLSRTPEALARFEREAKLTSRLQHAGVVPIYDVGAWNDGEPFFVMKMVEGRSLKDAISEAGSLDARLALLPRVLAAADAMAYAHGQGVIHRDLKPANVVMNDYGETVVIDWGLARLTSAAEESTAPGETDPDVSQGLTQQGRVLGTPHFMPPEQARGAAVDERADVYALGAIIYNVLAGESPYGGAGSRDVLARVQGGPPRGLLSHSRRLPLDLVAIVEKAMSRETADRYPTARELAADLRRFLNGQLVAAQSYSGWMLAARWARHHRAVIALLAALLAACIVGVGVVIVQRNTAVRVRRELEVRQNALVLLQAEQSLVDEATATAAWLRRYRPTPDNAWRARALAEEAVAIGVARHVFNFHLPPRSVAVSPDEPLMAAGTGDGRLSLFDLDTGQRRDLNQTSPVSTLAFSAHTGLLASGDTSGLLRIWTTKGQLLRERRFPAAISRMVFDSEGRQLALGQGHEAVALFDVPEDRTRASFHLGARLSGLAFCPVSNGLLVLDLTGRMFLLDGQGPPAMLSARHPDARLLCLPGGQKFVSAGVDGHVRLWDVATGSGLLLGKHDDWVTSIASARSGRLIATAGGDDTVRVFSVGGGPARVLRGHADTVRGLAFSEDERRIASVATDSTVIVWDLSTGHPVREYRSQRAGTNQLALTPGGRGILVSGPQEARLWRFEDRSGPVFRGHRGPITSLDWSPDGRALASASRDRTLRVWPLDQSTPFTSEPLEGWTMYVRFLGGPVHVLVNTRLGRPQIVNTLTGARTPIAEQDGLYSVPVVGGDRLAYPMHEGAFVHSLRTNTRVPIEGAPSAIADMAFTSDTAGLVIASEDGLVGIWDTVSGRPRASRQIGERIYELAMAPDDRSVGLITASNRLLLWQPHTNGLRELTTDRIAARELLFTTSSRLLYAAADLTLRWVDIDSGQSQTLRGHRARILDLVAAPAGLPLVASSDADGFVRVWNLRTMQRAVLRASSEAVEKAVFSPDGSALATAGQDALVRLWPVSDLAFTSANDADHGPMEIHTSAVIDENGTLGTP